MLQKCQVQFYLLGVSLYRKLNNCYSYSLIKLNLLSHVLCLFILLYLLFANFLLFKKCYNCHHLDMFDASLLFWFDRAVYEELGKYGDLENQVLCRERVEELEPSIRYCLHKIGESNLQTSELLHVGEMEGPALDLFRAKLEVSLFPSSRQFKMYLVCKLRIR